MSPTSIPEGPGSVSGAPSLPEGFADTFKSRFVPLKGGPVATTAIAGIRRTDLQQHDLGVPGREVIQNRVDIDPDAPAIRHWHPGEEIIYVLEGTLEYEIDGHAPTTVRAGEALMVPAEAVHAVKNIGTGNAAELATYVVEKDKPLLNLAEESRNV